MLDGKKLYHLRAINILLIELLLGQFLEETTSEWVLDGRGRFRWMGAGGDRNGWDKGFCGGFMDVRLEIKSCHFLSPYF